MTYEYWIFQQEEPQLCEPTPRGYSKKEKPLWLQKKELLQSLREEIGEEEFQKRIKEDEDREGRIQKYLENED